MCQRNFPGRQSRRSWSLKITGQGWPRFIMALSWPTDHAWEPALVIKEGLQRQWGRGRYQTALVVHICAPNMLTHNSVEVQTQGHREDRQTDVCRHTHTELLLRVMDCFHIISTYFCKAHWFCTNITAHGHWGCTKHPTPEDANWGAGLIGPRWYLLLAGLPLLLEKSFIRLTFGGFKWPK